MRTTIGLLSVLSFAVVGFGCSADAGDELAGGGENDVELIEHDEEIDAPVQTGATTPSQVAAVPVEEPPQTLTAATNNCLANPSKTVLSGAFNSQYKDQPKNGSTVDARGASWTLTEDWISTPKASTNVCWVGGEFKLTFDDSKLSPTAAWADIWHHNGGQTLKYNQANWVFDSITIRHVGDAFNLSTGAQNFTIRDSHIADVHDDCVQNDDMHAGDVHHNFFEGCYAGFSARASAGDTPNDGHLNTWNIHDNVIWMKPTRSVYKGDSPGIGQIIKWEKTNPQYAPKLVFKNNVVRVGKLPFQKGSSGDAFFFPANTDFSNNILYWDGPGKAPASLQAWFNAAHNSRIVYAIDDWNLAVFYWVVSHPGVK